MKHPLRITASIKAVGAHVRSLVDRVDHTDPWALRFAEHKIVYIPIPKAANSSIRRALLPLVNQTEDNVPHIQRFDGFEKVRYSRIAAGVDEGWYVFTVVRNPYSRFISAYLDKVKYRPQVLPAFAAMGARRDDSVEFFSHVVQRWPRELLNDHIMPQAMLLSQPTRLPNFRVHHVEDLPRDWPQISASISERSGKTIDPLSRSNARQQGPHWREYLTPPVRQFVNRVYAADFVAFGYETET